MAEEQGQERTEQASSKRREDFRKKGQVAQSREVNTAALMASSLLLWFFYAPFFWDHLSRILGGLWNSAASYEVTPLSVVLLGGEVVLRIGLLLTPLLLMVLVVGFMASFIQIGWLFTTKPLEPDFSRLDPIKGAAKFVSKRALVELVKSLAKVLLVGWVAYGAVESEFGEALYLAEMGVSETVGYIGRVAAKVLFRSCGVLILLAFLDFLFVRWEMEQKMKMTKQEQKEEYKETEGDPHLKSRIRSIQMQTARKRMMSEVPKADVIITNPTHLSVALQYDREKMGAPQIVAKGADHLAMKIRELARENGVPLVENKPVAQSLYRLELGAQIPEELFKAVAEILAHVYKLKRK